MTKHSAFLFDLNGTMIDDMQFHLDVWYEIIVKQLGGDLSLEEVKLHMYGKNQEVLIRIFGEQRFTIEELDQISFEKEKQYQQLYKPHLKPLPGLLDFMEQAEQGNIRMAIGSAAIPFNIDFVIDHLNVRNYFKAIVSADDVVKSKPHPETYTRAAKILNVSPESCIVFEDAPKGVEAALNAKMKAVVLTTMHPQADFAQYPNILLYVENYLDKRLTTLFQQKRSLMPSK